MTKPVQIPMNPHPEAGEVLAPATGTRSELLGGLASLVAWLAGSLGVIGGALYASGYLISVAQLHLLGVSHLVTYSQDHFVQQGGAFVLYLGEESIKIAATFGLVLGLPVLAVVAVRHWGGPLLAGWSNHIDRMLHGRAIPWCGIAYAALLTTLVLFSISILGTFSNSSEGTFGEWLTFSNVLFPTS